MSVEDLKLYRGSAQDPRERRSAGKGTQRPRFFWPPILNIGQKNDVSNGVSSHPFVIRVEEAHVQNTAVTKVNATVLEDVHQVEGGQDALQGQKQDEERKKKRDKLLSSKPFSLFFCKKKDKNVNVLDQKGTAPPCTPESVGLQDGFNKSNVLFRPVPKADFKMNGELPSLDILRNAPTLPSIHNYDEPLQHELKDLSSLYNIDSIQGGVQDKGTGDFTSVNFDIESYRSDEISTYDARPATRDGWTTATSLHLARSITAGIRPILPLPPLERAFSVSETLLDATQDSLENWMTHLHPDIRKIPLNHLFIPGSHDAFSFSLTPEEDIGPDAPDVVANLDSCCSCMARSAILRWSVTQKASVDDQLRHGIRYFDIRVAVRDSRFFFVHGLYGDDLEPLLSEISHFLMRHPGEVVLLDFQHFHGLSANDHAALITLLKTTFSDLLCPFFQQLKHLTLSYLARYKYQVLVFYRHDQSMQAVSWLWSSASIPNPWPDTTSVTKMISFLENNIQKRDPQTFFVTQCILTPSGKYLLRHFSGMLEKKMAWPCNREVGAWVAHQPQGPQGPNIVMTDFVEFDDWAIPRAVIKRNSSQVLPPTPLQKY